MDDFLFVYTERPSTKTFLLYIFAQIHKIPYMNEQIEFIKEIVKKVDEFEITDKYETHKTNIMGYLFLLLGTLDSKRSSEYYKLSEEYYKKNMNNNISRIGCITINILNNRIDNANILSSKLISKNRLESNAIYCIKNLILSYSATKGGFGQTEKIEIPNIKDVRILNNLAVCEWNKRNKKNMKILLERAVEISSIYLFTKYNLGLVNLFNDTKESYNILVDVAKQWNLGLLLCNLSISQVYNELYNDALSTISKAIRNESGNYMLYMTRASIYLMLKQKEKANDDLTIASKIFPTNPFIYLLRTQTYEISSNAIPDYSILLYLDPNIKFS